MNNPLRQLEAAIEATLPETLQDYLSNVDKNWNYITPNDLFSVVNKGLDEFLIVDLRRPEDYATGHIKGAINIFWLDMMKNLDKLPKDKRILVYCYVGHTSSQVLVLLRLLGYDVVSLKFGMGISPVQGIAPIGWIPMGYPVEK